VVRAPTREGMARLEIGPRHTLFAVGQRNLSVSEHFVTIAKNNRTRHRPRSLRLDQAHLFVARGDPVEEVGIWYEGRPGVVTRIFGMRPPKLLDGTALAAWRALDHLLARFRAALAPHPGAAVRASELGRGADRVLVVDTGDRYVVFVRRLFRELPRRALEVHADGSVIIPHRSFEARVKCMSRYGVTVLGDRIQFADPDGVVLADIWLPWVTPEDRVALAERFGLRLDQDLDTPPIALTFPR
jgi:hypothetical protein